MQLIKMEVEWAIAHPDELTNNDWQNETLSLFYFVAFDGLYQFFVLYYCFHANGRLPEQKLSNDW